LALPKEVPLILTNARAQASAWGNECWDKVIDQAKARGVPLLIVVLAAALKRTNDAFKHQIA
jgi:hypothetical protein